MPAPATLEIEDLSIAYATEEGHLGDDILFRQAAYLVEGLTVLRAAQLETTPSLLAVFDTPEPRPGDEFLAAFRANVGQSPADYIAAIKALPPEVSTAGVRWLQQVVDDRCARAGSVTGRRGRLSRSQQRPPDRAAGRAAARA